MFSKLTLCLMMVFGAMASTAFGSSYLGIQDEDSSSSLPLLDRLLATFDWNIQSNDDWVVDFSEATASNEIVGSYNTSVQNYTITLHDEDCTSAITDIDAAGIAFTSASTGIGQDNLQVQLDLVQSKLLSTSPIVFPVGTDNAVMDIRFCVRLDLVYKQEGAEDVSVNFHQTKFDIQVNMTSGFEITAFTSRTEAELAQDTVNLDNYNVTAHRLEFNESDFEDMDAWAIDSNPQTLTNGVGKNILAVVIVANNAPAEGVIMDKILSFQFNLTNGGVAYDMADSEDYVGGVLWQPVCGTFQDKPACGFKTIVISEYFQELGNQSATGTGEVLFKFGSTQPARRLTRTLQATTNSESSSQFELDVGIEGVPIDPIMEEQLDSGAMSNIITTSSFMAIFMIGSLMFYM